MAEQIGHNNPPTPFDEIKRKIEGLREEASHWLDGGEVKTQAEADNIQTLLDLTREAKKSADAARKDELKPHDEAKTAIQAKWNALIGKNKSVTGVAILIEEGCKKALAPFLAEQERIRQEQERAAREEAERKQREAQQVLAAGSTNIDEREKGMALADQAMKARKAADQIAKQKPQAKGRGRAVSLRTRKIASVTNYTEAGRYLWLKYTSEFEPLINRLAQAEIDRGITSIPGVQVVEERSVA